MFNKTSSCYFLVVLIFFLFGLLQSKFVIYINKIFTVYLALKVLFLNILFLPYLFALKCAKESTRICEMLLWNAYCLESSRDYQKGNFKFAGY